MLQFVPNYVHVVGEKFVPGSLHATEDNIETLHRPQIFLNLQSIVQLKPTVRWF